MLGPQVSPLEQVLVAVDDRRAPSASLTAPIPQVCPRCFPGRRFAGRSPAESQLVMSERTRNLPRRSCLSVPGSSEKMLAKGPSLPADMVFLDLEDAVVAAREGGGARPRSSTPSRTTTGATRVLCVRVNAWDTEWTAYDVIEVVGNAGERLDEIMLPEGADGGRGRRPRPAAHPGREERRPARRATSASRRRSRRRAASSTSRRSARRQPAARDDHPRPGRHVGVDGDAVAAPAACRSPSTRATTSTTCS